MRRTYLDQGLSKQTTPAPGIALPRLAVVATDAPKPATAEPLNCRDPPAEQILKVLRMCFRPRVQNLSLIREEALILSIRLAIDHRMGPSISPPDR